MTTSQHEVVIIGAGPAGLAAGLYAARDGYAPLLLEKNGLPGGQIMLTEKIENFPGMNTIAGFELIENMKNQVERFGAKIEAGMTVDSIVRREDGMLEISVNRGEAKYLARAVILAPGSDYRKLGVPGEDQMRQAGRVSYCATCDGAFYKGKNIVAVGGGNTAVEDALYLATRFAGKVTLIHRRNEFRAQKVLMDELHEQAKKNLEIMTPCVIEQIVPSADGMTIDHVAVKNVQTGQTSKLTPDGVFIFVGMSPNTGWLKGIVQIDETGYIAADPVTMKSSTPGVFVAGDCRQRAAMQLATACADGVIAAMQLKEYFRNTKSW